MSGTGPGTMDTIFTISGIFFLYYFLVRLSGKTGNDVHGVQKPDRFPGSWTKLSQFPGSFLLYHFLVRLSGKQVISVQLPGFSDPGSMDSC